MLKKIVNIASIIQHYKKHSFLNIEQKMSMLKVDLNINL